MDFFTDIRVFNDHETVIDHELVLWCEMPSKVARLSAQNH